MATRVRLYWNKINNPKNEYIQWNEICARACEQFGLPGDRFTTCIDRNWMDFIFTSEKDAVLFMLEHGGNIISEEQTTVELIASKF
jgi:hypothetical protein